MEFKANQEFRVGHTTYKAGKTYDAPEGEVTVFVMNGWAEANGLTTPPEATRPKNTTMHIHNASSINESES